jgi:ATP-dependent helicase IRC3
MSQNLFAQMIGRGLRLSPATDKKDCLVIDLVGNTQRGLVSAPSLFGLDPQTPVNNASVADLTEQISQAVDQVDEVSESSNLDDVSVHYQHPTMQSLLQGQKLPVYRISQNAWIHCGNNVFVLSLLQVGYIRVEKEKNGLWSSQICRKLPNSHRTAKAVMVSEDTDDFSRCIRICDTVAARYMTAIQRGTGALLRTAAWRNAPATPQQQSTLRKMVGDSLERLLAVAGLAPKSGPAPSFNTLTKGQAGALFILCQHGARGRVLKAAKADEALIKRKTKLKQVNPKVTVGPLPRQPELRP